VDAPEIEPRSDLGQVSSQISREIVQLHARLYGRGPTRAKTYLTGDYALSILEEIFTPAERTLIAAGKGELVQASRTAFQDAVRDEFVTIVEETTGRPVRALISQVHLETGSAIELFLFASAVAPTSGADNSGSEDGDGRG
jgi:uncharacterized protein YbcI